MQQITARWTRLIHTSQKTWATEKSLLASLRKKTGYTFTNCKKALELHNNDIIKAENWLKEQAQQLGWTKATKLEGRQTSQGLVGVAVSKSNAAIVEVNCETDFVARNEQFKNFVETATSACLNFIQNQQHFKDVITTVKMDTDQLKQIPAGDGKSLSDHLALMIGQLGENSLLRRAFCVQTNDSIHLSAYAHPSGNSQNNIMLGKFAGIVALRQITPLEIDLNIFGRDICQHIVGMNPKKIGTLQDKPADNVDEETCLLYQEYLIDPSFTVKDVLLENNVEVVDFKRFECGEVINESGDRPLQFVETCQ